MVTGRLEEFLQPGLRSQKYAAIEPQRLVTVLEKYRWAALYGLLASAKSCFVVLGLQTPVTSILAAGR